MEVFLPTLSQMGFLFLLIVIGYTVSRTGVVSDNAPAVLSKLENTVFIPALVLGTFLTGFTVKTMASAWQFLLGGLVVSAVSIPSAILLARVCSKDAYIRKIYTYGLAFSNFGFMGNAVVQAMFPDIFPEYLIFVLFFWVFIYMWGVPVLLIPNNNGAEEDPSVSRSAARWKSIKSRLKCFVNPMFISMLIGMILGLLTPVFVLPDFVLSAVGTLGSCMSPIAMLLTGMTIAKISLKDTFTNVSIYAITFIRILVFPMLGILFFMLVPVPRAISVCAVAALAMPLGLNTVVVPSAYGLDTKVAAGMALVSHLLSCISIPVIFMLFEMLVK